MAEGLTAPPILSTPEQHILAEEISQVREHPPDVLTDEEIYIRYEVQRTLDEIRQHKWRRVALQFPDQMLPHSARVFQLLSKGMRTNQQPASEITRASPPEKGLHSLSLDERDSFKLTILGDTSYGSCCVDEIAAEHVDADAVVHYGRACLSPTARLPVLHIFTMMDLDQGAAIASFRDHFPDLQTKVILTADAPYADHVQRITRRLEDAGYTNVFPAAIVQDPSSSIPNRTVPESVSNDTSTLAEWHLFHISDPPTALLLTLISRIASIKIFPTSNRNDDGQSLRPADIDRSTQVLLRRRYGLVTSLTTVSTWGILINTLSVKNYLSMLSHIQRLITSAGKKSYLFVVGKLNAAKIANFSEIGGWVVIGCWESSLIDSKEFYKPIITPFELELALQSDHERVWTGQWRGDFQTVLEGVSQSTRRDSADEANEGHGWESNEDKEEESDESESEPPEFDLRTGRYISRTRPVQTRRVNGSSSSTALTKRNKGDLIAVNGISSPAAEYLHQQRTWKGLGSDLEIRYEESETSSAIEEGRTGVARGYTVGESSKT